MLGRSFFWVGLVALPIVVAACGGDSFSRATNANDASTPETGSIDAAVDGGTCEPKQCPDLHFTCGAGSDQCGGTVNCGQCHTANYACADHACVCKPKTCKDLGYDCGEAPDGCGQRLVCGTCPSTQTCGAGGDHKCGTGVCVAKTCAQLGANCGPASDGCGASLDCGACTAPKTCGGSGAPNQCGCTPKTCAQQGWQCGSGDDGCGGTLNCPTCAGGTCTNHQCVACTPTTTCASKGYTCGSIKNDCGATEACGPAPLRDPNGDRACTSGSKPFFYACQGCGPGMTASPSPRAPQPADAGSCIGGGNTPPEPGWDCEPISPSLSSATAWCCAQ